VSLQQSRDFAQDDGWGENHHQGKTEGLGSIRLDYQNRIADAPCVIEMDRGLFPKEGVSVKAFRFDNGPACAEPLFTGAADLGRKGKPRTLFFQSSDRKRPSWLNFLAESWLSC
jgi:hypothetical protein